MNIIKVWFDGGAVPNPGRAYGSYEIQSELLNHKSIRQEFGWPLTNNQAEYLSLIAALKWLSHHADPKTSKLQIMTDSRLVSRQLMGGWRVKVCHIKDLWQQTRDLLEPYGGWIINWHGRKNNVERFGH